MAKHLFAAAFVFATFAAQAGPEIREADLATGLAAQDNNSWVRVHGVIDACTADACFICPDWKNASRQNEVFRRTGCVSLVGWKDANARVLLDELYRFSEVEMIARFRFKEPDAADVNVLCLDFRRCEPSGFDEAVVTKLIERRAVEKVPNSVPGDRVVAINPADDAALRKLFWDDRDFSLVFLDGPETEIRTYLRPQKEHGPLEGWLCYARKSVVVNADEPFPWPTTYRAVTLRSPANPYRCRLAWKEKGVWRIVRELQKQPVYGLD